MNRVSLICLLAIVAITIEPRISYCSDSLTDTLKTRINHHQKELLVLEKNLQETMESVKSQEQKNGGIRGPKQEIVFEGSSGQALIIDKRTKIEKSLDATVARIHALQNSLEADENKLKRIEEAQQNNKPCPPNQNGTRPMSKAFFHVLGKIGGFEFTDSFAEYGELEPSRSEIYANMLKDLNEVKHAVDEGAEQLSMRQKLISKMFCTGESKSVYIKNQIEGFKRQDQYLKNADLKSEVKNKSGLMHHPSKNSPAITQMMLKSGPDLMVEQYLTAKKTGNTADFFKNAFSYTWSCFEGRYRQISDYAQSKGDVEIDEDLLLQTDSKKSDEDNLFEHLRVFKNSKINNFIQDDNQLKKIWEEKFNVPQKRFGEEWENFKLSAENNEKFKLTQHDFEMHLRKQLKENSSLLEALPSLFEVHDYLFTE